MCESLSGYGQLKGKLGDNVELPAEGFAGQHYGWHGCIQLTQHGLKSEEPNVAYFLPVLLC